MAATRGINGIVVVVILAAAALNAVEDSTADGASRTVNSVYPGLATGALTHAVLGEMPDGVLLRSDGVEISSADVAKRIADAPPAIRKELEANAFFLLEDSATAEILLDMGRKQAAGEGIDPSSRSRNDLIRPVIDRAVEKTSVSEEEVKRFYEENKEALCGATLAESKKQIEEYLLNEKKDRVLSVFIRDLGKQRRIMVSEAWAKEKSVPARDNPVDRVRWNGKPTLVDFGGKSCCGPDGMLPIIESVRKSLDGKANVLYLEARENPVLAARYGVNSIPSQLVFDAKGAESYRHYGAMSEADILAKLRTLEVK